MKGKIKGYYFKTIVFSIKLKNAIFTQKQQLTLILLIILSIKYLCRRYIHCSGTTGITKADSNIPISNTFNYGQTYSLCYICR